jgi:hypothetical protein
MVDRGRRRQEARRRFVGIRRVSAQGQQCSPALVGEDEDDEAEPEAGSLEHERRQRGGMTVVEDVEKDSRRADARAVGGGAVVVEGPRGFI